MEQFIPKVGFNITVWVELVRVIKWNFKSLWVALLVSLPLKDTPCSWPKLVEFRSVDYSITESVETIQLKGLTSKMLIKKVYLLKKLSTFHSQLTFKLWRISNKFAVESIILWRLTTWVKYFPLVKLIEDKPVMQITEKLTIKSSKLTEIKKRVCGLKKKSKGITWLSLEKSRPWIALKLSRSPVAIIITWLFLLTESYMFGVATKNNNAV